MLDDQKLELLDNGGAGGEGVRGKFDLTAGGLAVNSNLNTPLWSLAVAQLRTTPKEDAPGHDYDLTVTTFGLSSTGLAQASATTLYEQNVYGHSDQYGTDADNQIRPALQAYDYRARTVFLGAPLRITFNDLISTDFVLEEPPKHAYWDEAQGKLQVVSRVPGIAVSMTNKEGVTFSGMSTDTSAHSEGSSDAASASLSAGGGFLSLSEVKASVEVTSKESYNYDTNKSSYDRNYSSRSLSEAESTDNDDFISGRMQTMDIWRYRVLGVAGTVDGKPVNTFYDVLLPGPTSDFHGSGLDFGWYQPRHENGNILSYPSPSSDDPSSPSTFSPPDLGSYEIPCPQPGDPTCKNGTLTKSGAMIPATEEFISGTSGFIGLDYSNNTGSGNTISYQHKTGTSTDVKVGYSAKASIFGATLETKGGYEHNFNSNDSWGNAQTSDTTTTSDTGIKIARSEIDASQAYEFFPTVYTTLDGTIKVAHAVDPLGSAAGKPFWAGLYGGKPDPALNLPLRFVRELKGLYLTWVPNALISRKQMRGFFVMSANPNPVSGEYDILALAPVDGDKVRLSAQVYNYSTAKSFTDCLVQFYKIKLDPDTDREIGPRQLIETTLISLLPRATAPAQIIWDTKGSGGPNGQAYRIYVDLNYAAAKAGAKPIDELYPPEMPDKSYAPELPKGSIRDRTTKVLAR